VRGGPPRAGGDEHAPLLVSSRQALAGHAALAQAPGGAAGGYDAASTPEENAMAADNETIPGSRAVAIGANDTLTVGGDQVVQVGRNATRSVQSNEAIAIGKDLKVSVGKHLVIQAGDSLTLKVGAASVTLKKDGSIVLKGTDISIEGSGKVNVKASGDVVLKGSKILQN
jgi:type VI secretion system secreted protein VgrG